MHQAKPVPGSITLAFRSRLAGDDAISRGHAEVLGS
jgi:hypothetical protein